MITNQKAHDEELQKIVRKGSNKGGKMSRNKRKASRTGSPLNRFVKGQISGEEYFRLTNQSVKR